MIGPCLCGDPGCASCGQPGMAELEEATEQVCEMMEAAKLDAAEMRLAARVGIVAAFLARRLTAQRIGDARADDALAGDYRESELLAQIESLTARVLTLEGKHVDSVRERSVAE